jgi:hypothetical protein
MAKLSSTTTTAVERITPDMADKWLQTMKMNRPLNQDKIVAMAISMDGSEYIDNGETIKFYDNGELFDGQHRLRACILAGKPFVSSVARGISDRRAFATVDVGNPRKHSDMFALTGYNEPRTISTAAIVLLFYKSGHLTLKGPRGTREQLYFAKSLPKGKGKHGMRNYSRAVDKEKLLKFAEPYREALSHAMKAVRHFGVKDGMISRPLAVTCYLLFAEKSLADADSFWGDFGRGAGLKENDPVHRLREKLTSNALSGHQKLTRWAVMALTIKAWNKRRAGTPVTNLRLEDIDSKMPKVK